MTGIMLSLMVSGSSAHDQQAGRKDIGPSQIQLSGCMNAGILFQQQLVEGLTWDAWMVRTHWLTMQ